MPKKNTFLKEFSVLTWRDLEEWAGTRIVDRGRRYQQQGRVAELSVTEDDALLAWVHGTEKYVTKVIMDDGGLPESTCTCPYGFDCKHGVAVVIEYLKRVENNKPVSKAKQNDDRLNLLEDEYWDDGPNDAEGTMPDNIRHDIEGLLKGKTKAQLIELIHDLAGQYPEIAGELSDRWQLAAGNAEMLMVKLRREIQEIGDEPGWQNYWQNEGFTPDYSGVRKKLKTLLKAGHTGEILTIGRELITTGFRQVEESHDEGETETEVASCMPIIVDALEKSSLDCVEKLNYALDAVLEDQFEICEAFAVYLHRQHPKSGWHDLADWLLARLDIHISNKGSDDFRRNYERNRLSGWAIHALEQAGREDEIIPLCIAEAKRTCSYERLVKRLVAARRYEDAEHWIEVGIRATKDKWPGIASGLRDKLREIRTIEKNWHAVTTMQVEEFVRHPSRQAFIDCKKVSGRIKAWPKVRNHLLCFLEKGELPWNQKDWSLPESGLDRPDANRRKRFPLIDDLIDIAILEKKPAQVLKWYDQRPKDHFGWYGLNENDIATAVQDHAPDRAVGIWKDKAERLIAQVKPSAYQAAAKYLAKAAKVMSKAKKHTEWERYLQGLREKHARKRRLLEILDAIGDKPIIAKHR
jgi:uncharacterized Zn finger protein